MPEGARVDGVHGLAQVQLEVLSGPTPVAVKGNCRNRTGHDGDGDAGTETVCRRQDRVLPGERHDGPAPGSRQADVRQEAVEGGQRIEFVRRGSGIEAAMSWLSGLTDQPRVATCMTELASVLPLVGRAVVATMPAGIASEQGGDADRGEDRGAGCVEEPGVDAVDEGVAGVGAGRPTGVDGDGEGGPCLVDERGRDARKLQAGAVDGGDDAADDGRAECAADLAGEVVQRGAHPLLRLGQRLGDGRGGGRHGRAHADAERDETGEHQQVRRCRSRPAR